MSDPKVFTLDVYNTTSMKLGEFKNGLDRAMKDFAAILGTLPSFNLLSHRLKVSLYPVDADRDAADQRERLRVSCEHWCEETSP